VEGREDAVRRQIAEGSPRMPAFKYALQPSEVEAILQYLKRVDNAPM
jgi:mono/diheme cytochrome c family protein